MDIDEYSLYYLENGTDNSTLLDACFEPAKHIKPKTPFNLTLQYANGTYRFFWKNGYENHIYKGVLPILYEFKYYKDGNHASAVSVQAGKDMIQIDEMKLDPGTTYTVMVKTRIEDGNVYRGMWSDWSSAVEWKTEYRDEPNQVSKIAIGMFSMVGLLILLMSIPAARFKMKEISWVPTPAPYFQPLYQNHQGNFQSLNVACLSGDVLSLKDSALSLEGLEDCKAFEAPVIINPVPVCFRQDYCTLTNTPTGPVPTFTRDVEQDENTSND
ncbi:interleukin 21 receptor, tandem duplicate 2 [Sinocyclocheilus grahami]|uniref:interleukin 21 receptor, tandem duplicate 2 n=1 Tax=Sinocyclocheilus grahami TaxID=75366 RepID=UPI0007AD31B2|nr:PREDICTED: interleukin-21 receptor-like [Sinocyclocheilus grahami]